MAYPAITLTYTAIAKALTPGSLVALMQAVPPPEPLLEELGCWILADSTVTDGNAAVRTIEILAVSAVQATCTPNLQVGYSGSPIESISVTGGGGGYVRPPVGQVFESSGETLPQFLGKGGKGARLQAYLGLAGAESATAINVGTGYSAQTVAGLVGGMPLGTGTVVQARPGFGAVDPSLFTGSTGCGTRVSDPPAHGALNTRACVRSVAVTNGGKGYHAATTKVVFLGPPGPSGRAAFAFPTLDAMGRITAVSVVDPGLGYITTPTVAFVDTHTTPGLGATATCNMMRGHAAALAVNVVGGAVTAIDINDPGDGYVTMPTLVIFDPSGMGAGAVYSVGPVPNVSSSLFSVSRVDVLARGSGYVHPTVTLQDFYSATGLVALSRGEQSTLIKPFSNLMKTALANALGTPISETIA